MFHCVGQNWNCVSVDKIMGKMPGLVCNSLKIRIVHIVTYYKNVLIVILMFVDNENLTKVKPTVNYIPRYV